MRKIFKAQTLMSKIFIGVAIVVFLFSLYFMTDYQDLFGLKLPVNAPVAEFYGRLQLFNQIIFFGGLLQVILFVASLILETGKKVPDRLALYILVPMLVLVLGATVYGIVRMPSLMAEYEQVDFSKLKLEAGPENYIYKYTAFYVGFVVFAINIVACVFYGFILVKSHLAFVKLHREDAV